VPRCHFLVVREKPRPRSTSGLYDAPSQRYAGFMLTWGVFGPEVNQKILAKGGNDD
jgi:hypothetical protein